MNKLYLLLVLITSLFLTSRATESAGHAESDRLVLTIAILSDLHNQQELISGGVENVRLRGTVTKTLEKIKKEENIDLLVLDGDYTSDVSIPQENWEKIRRLIYEASQKAFREDATNKPVLFINGNHEYEVGKDNWGGNGSATYNAGDYYTFPMKTNVGELNENECFYEKTTDGKFDLLAAFHYVINGFDFICLNTGKHLYTDAWNYQYSIESVTWCKNKLEEISKDDPDKTIFFMAHLPFADSKNIHQSGSKGLAIVESTTLLKSTLAKYKNLIYLYGHDHGGDNAYIRTETAQRVTHYDSRGNLYSEAGSDEPDTQFCIKDIRDHYLGYSDLNLNLLENENVCTVTNSDDQFRINIDGTVEQSNLYFSTSSLTFSGNKEAKDMLLFKIDNPEGVGELKTTQVSSIENGKSYLIVFKADDIYYALTNESNGKPGGERRLKPVSLSVNNTEVVYSDINPNDDYSALWTITKKEQVRGVKSFFSSFVGSMRYYNNSIDGSVGINDSRIFQALLIYVYADRVVLQTKNYGESGVINGITISETPAPFISERLVSNSTLKYEFKATSGNEIEGVVISTPAGGCLKENTPITVTAQPLDGFVFEKWINDVGDLLSTDNPYMFELMANTSIYAQFKKRQKPEPDPNPTPEPAPEPDPEPDPEPAPVYYDFVIIPSNEVIGSVSSKPEAGRLKERTWITITAVPQTGFMFEKWTNGRNETLSAENPYTFNLEEKNAVIYANFRKSEIDTGVEIVTVESPSAHISNSILHLKNIKAGAKITVMDIAGRVVSMHESKEDSINISLPIRQIYIVKISHSGTYWVLKIVE